MFLIRCVCVFCTWTSPVNGNVCVCVSRGPWRASIRPSTWSWTRVTSGCSAPVRGWSRWCWDSTSSEETTCEWPLTRRQTRDRQSARHFSNVLTLRLIYWSAVGPPWAARWGRTRRRHHWWTADACLVFRWFVDWGGTLTELWSWLLLREFVSAGTEPDQMALDSRVHLKMNFLSSSQLLTRLIDWLFVCVLQGGDRGDRRGDRLHSGFRKHQSRAAQLCRPLTPLCLSPWQQMLCLQVPCVFWLIIDQNEPSVIRWCCFVSVCNFL